MLRLALLVGTLIGLNGYLIGSTFYSVERLADEQPLLYKKDMASETQYFIEPVAMPNFYPIRDWSVLTPSVPAKAGAVFDVQSGKLLFEKNIRERLPIASLTKIMTAMVVRDMLDLDQTIVVSGTAIAKSKLNEGGEELTAGEVITVKQLLKIMLIKSSNDAAYMFEETLQNQGLSLVDLMNKKGEALGLLDTFFTDPSGLEDQESYSTVADLITLIQHSLSYPVIYEISGEIRESFSSVDGATRHELVNTNELLQEFDNIVGGKTGYTDIALGCIMLVQDRGGEDRTISVILGSPDRFQDMRTMVNWTNDAYKWQEERP